jgi:hypothetical protein
MPNKPAAPAFDLSRMLEIFTSEVLRQYTHLTWAEAKQQLRLNRSEMSIVCSSCGILPSEWKQNQRKQVRGGQWQQPPPTPPPPPPLPCAPPPPPLSSYPPLLDELLLFDELPLFGSSMSCSADYNDHDHAAVHEGNAVRCPQFRTLCAHLHVRVQGL